MKNKKGQFDTYVAQKYTYRPHAVRRSRTVVFDLEKYPDMADQSQLKDTDINTIVARYLQKGIVPQLNTKGIFADTTQFPDLQQATNAIIEAQNIFLSLPSTLREQFGNNPNAFFTFLKTNHIQLDEYLRNPQNFSDKKSAEPTTPTEVPSNPPETEQKKPETKAK